MASFSIALNDVVRRFFVNGQEEDASLSPEKNRHGHITCAAPSSVYEPGSVFQRPGELEQGSYFHQGSVLEQGSVFQNEGSLIHNGSVCQTGSVLQNGSVIDGSYMQSGSVMHGSSVYEGGSVCPAASSQVIIPRCTTAVEVNPTGYLKRPMPTPERTHGTPFKDGLTQFSSPKAPAAHPSPEGRPVADPQMQLKGASFLISDVYKAREAHFFLSDPEDVVDVEVGDYFKAHPEMYLRTNFTRVRRGVYSMSGREVRVEWAESKNKDGKGRLIVRDGHSKAPFGDFMEMQDTLQKYNSNVLQGNGNIHMIPQECRMTFCDPGVDYSRTDAMKMAMEQAKEREAAATNLLTKQSQSFDRVKMQEMKHHSFGTPSRQKQQQQPETRSPGFKIGSLPTPPRIMSSPVVNKTGARTPPRVSNVPPTPPRLTITPPRVATSPKIESDGMPPLRLLVPASVSVSPGQTHKR